MSTSTDLATSRAADLAATRATVMAHTPEQGRSKWRRRKELAIAREAERSALVETITKEMGRQLSTLERTLLDQYCMLVVRTQELRAQGRIGELTDVVRLMARIAANLGIDRRNARRANGQPVLDSALARHVEKLRRKPEGNEEGA
jgi:hypothetical protein